jgi:hypothetical protein
MNDETVSMLGHLLDPETDPKAAFLAFKGELEAIADDDLVPLNVDLEQAVSIAIGASVRLQVLKPGFAKLFFADEHDPDRLRLVAQAALYTHILATGAVAKDERFPALIEEAAQLREALLCTAELLAKFGELAREQVAEIRSGTGHLDTASGLLSLACLFETNWYRLHGMVPVKFEQVVRARALGNELFELIGTRRYVPAPVAADDPARMRLRAFTLLLRYYDHCRRAVVALRWNEGDADAFMPTLYPKRRRRLAEITSETPESEVPSGVVGSNDVLPIDLRVPA